MAPKTQDGAAAYGSLGATAATPTEESPLAPKKASPSSDVLIKTQSSFWEDAKEFREGSIPHSMVLALVIGIVCGVAAWIYYSILFWVLEYVWHELPQKIIVGVWPEWAYVYWIPIVGFTMAIGVGLTVVYMGEPGDLPYTIKCVHESAYIAMDHVMPMVCASQFSIVGGGSLGPEAPLVAICAALGGYISRVVFKQTQRNLIRKHTLMGMASALAAFFGCPLGGSLFALEVNSRFGVEYFEHTIEAIFAGEVCLIVFRGLARLPIEPIWEIVPDKLTGSDPLSCVYGLIVGLLGALVAYGFAKMHQRVMAFFAMFDLTPARSDLAIRRALLGAVVVVGLGMIVPHTMFWGEFEFDTISTLTPASTLEHIWPTAGLFGFELSSTDGLPSLIVGITKLIAVSFTVAGGYRGGYIFPAMAAGAALGNFLHLTFLWFIPQQLCCLCMAGAINVAITRTSIATTLILVYLAGEPNAMSAVLAASLVSLFATGYMPFIKTQIARADLDRSLYHLDEDDEEGESTTLV